MNCSLAFVAAAIIAPVPERTVYNLRNVAAADTAQAVTAFATQKKLPITVVADPLSNSVSVTGRGLPRKLAVALLAKLDRTPERFLVNMSVIEAPEGFVEDTGLEEGEKWTLTQREANLFNAAVRKAANSKVTHVIILTRPQLMTLDNQTGYIQVGSEVGGISARVTPRITTEGAVLTRLEMQLAKVARGGVMNCQTIETTEQVPDGGTLLVRGPRTKTSQGVSRELLILMTVNRVAPSDR